MEKQPHELTRDDVQLENTHIGFNGYFSVLEHTLSHTKFDGSQTPTFKREVFERGQAVAVLIHDPVQDTVVLVEQFRPGALDDALSPWMVEVVAGMIDEGEDPAQTAVREALEETGLAINAPRSLYRYYSSPGACTETLHLFYATADTRALNTQKAHGMVDENEDIRVHCISRATAMEWLADGKIRNGVTLIALQWLALQQGL